MKKSITRVLISLAAFALILVRFKWPTIETDTVTIVLLAVVFLPWIAVLVESAELPGGWKVKFQRLKNEQEEQKNDIESLKFLISHFVTDDEYKHLRKLADNKDFPYIRGPETSFFHRELHRLRSFGLIEGHHGKGIRTLMNQGGDLKDHFRITDVGRKYLDLRDEIKK